VLLEEVQHQCKEY